MDSEDDIQPLIQYARSNNIDQNNTTELTSQRLNADCDFDQVVYGYQKSRWKTFVTYFLSSIMVGFPFLVFHWVPRWLVYLTSVPCCFQVADTVVILETYQKKCKNFFIHKVRDKNICDSSGLLNAGFESDVEGEKEVLENADDIFTPIPLDDGSRLTLTYYRYFRHKKQCFIWDGVRGRWCLLAGVERGATCAQLQAMGSVAPSSGKRVRMLNVFGLNEITVPVQSILTLVLLEVFNPFYVFQAFTICVWLAEPYYYYCLAIVLMSSFGVVTSVIQTKKNQQSLKATVEAYSSIQLWDGRTVDSRAIAPGDVIVVPSKPTVMLCDAALLNGAVVVNESMLTGESVPVTKTALQKVDKPFDMKENNSNILFCGTKVIQTKYYSNEPVKALVLRTGYNTSKGQLVRSILYPVPADFKFDRDSYKFIFILACIAIVGLSYTIALKAYRALTPGDIAIKALDIITIVIPPALPAAMTVGRLYAVNRLKKARITCLNTRAVNVSGSLDCICFDKTGTLTCDGLEMWGVVPMTSSGLLGSHKDPKTLAQLSPLRLGMASCHSLTLLGGELVGDPLDVKMFEATDWVLEEPNVPDAAKYEMLTPTIVKPKKSTGITVDGLSLPLELGIIHQYQFVSSLQRSSVAVKVLGEDVTRIFCKGAPEMLRTLCRPETVPQNLNQTLSHYAEKGYRVIALSTRVMEVKFKDLEKMHREEVEKDLEFLGLVILENRLKPATTGIIRELKEANIQVVMITGDNIHTAVSVAKECGILASGERVVQLHVDRDGDSCSVYCESTLHGTPVGRRTALLHSYRSSDSGIDSGTSGALAHCAASTEAPQERSNYKIVMTGEVWQVIREQYASMIGQIIERGAVFARMTSEQKQQLIVEYQALGYYVGMCGDGANDCGALKAAHTGISLSELESSVAAPFTSTHPDIVCVSRVLREGRAALTTSFGVFKFMIAYSLTEFFSVAFLYYFDANLTDFQFLFIDVGLIVNFAFFFGMTEAYTGPLCKIPPLTSLLGLIPLVSLLGQLLLIVLFQYLSYLALTYFPWYVRHTYEGEEANECWENYAIYTVSMFQYIIMAVVFSHGAPYRKSVITNTQLMVSSIIMTGIATYITVVPAKWLAEFLQLRMPKDILMSYIVLILATSNFILALFFERFVVQFLMEDKQCLPAFVKERHVRKTPHLMIKRQLTDMDYLECASVVTFDKELNGAVSDSSINKGR